MKLQWALHIVLADNVLFYLVSLLSKASCHYNDNSQLNVFTFSWETFRWGGGVER